MNSGFAAVLFASSQQSSQSGVQACRPASGTVVTKDYFGHWHAGSRSRWKRTSIDFIKASSVNSITRMSTMGIRKKKTPQSFFFQNELSVSTSAWEDAIKINQ